MTKDVFLQGTRSVCPQCLRNIPADIVRRGNKVFLCRHCPEHGPVEEVIWRGQPDFTVWKRPKTYNSQFLRQSEAEHGCPFDCGLCENHRQKSCAVLYELTDDCNLRCPVCFASSGETGGQTTGNTGRADKAEKASFAKTAGEKSESGGQRYTGKKAVSAGKNCRDNKDDVTLSIEAGTEDTASSGAKISSEALTITSGDVCDEAFMEHRRVLYWIHEQAGQAILQLSGGEPTLSPWLVPLVQEASRLFPAVQLNTNGLLLAKDNGLAEELAEAGLGWVFLQFDGTRDDIYERLRGRALYAVKEKAIANCRRAGLAVVLVPTVASGVNDDNLGEIVRFALKHAPTVRGVHFQPMTRSGRNLLPDAPSLTLPEILQGLEEQTGGMVKIEHAVPPGCEHERCSFHCRYTLHNGQLVHTPSSCCCAGTEMSQGNRPENATGVTRGNTMGGIPSEIAGGKSEGQGTAPMPVKAEYLQGRPESSDLGADRAIASVVHNWQKAPDIGGVSPKEADSFDAFIARHRATIFSITCMAFQDVWNLDLQRLQGCCIHVYAKPDRLIPFCAYNLTDSSGKSLYRHDG